MASVQVKRSSVCCEPLENRQLLAGEPWGAFPKLIEQDAAVNAFPTITGAGQTIAILDTGADYLHPNLGGGFGPGFKIVGGYDFVANTTIAQDHVGHGTGVSSAAAGNRFVYRGATYQGIAPGANLVELRVDDADGVVDASMEKALQWVIANRTKYNIVSLNISDGGWTIYPNKTTTGSIYSDELAQLKSAGVFISVCSGNDGVTSPLGVEYPAADPSAFSVGSINVQDKISSFSTRGAIMDLVAPGEDLPLAYLNISGQPIYLGATGTSFSCPEVAGLAALLKQVDKTLTPDQEMALMKSGSQPVYDSATGLTFKRIDIYDTLALAIARRDGVASTPYSTTPVAPATIQAENFDNGGEGIGYHDRETANFGSVYRTTGVDIEKTSDTGGGYQVSYTRAGEWLNYTINVGTSGTYAFSARVASLGTGGSFHIEVDGVNRTGTLTVPNTGGWQKWQTITSAGVSLSAGKHVLRLVMDGAGASGFVGNFNWIRAATSGIRPAKSTSYFGTPLAVPAIIEAEKYDLGGAGVAYNDLTGGNAGNVFRSDDVDIQTVTGSRPGYALAYTQAGEWLNYTVNVATAGTYNFSTLVAALGAGGKFHLEVDGVNKTGQLSVPNTGGWTNWTTVSKTGISLSAGTHVLRLVMDSAGSSGFVGNFDYLRIYQ